MDGPCEALAEQVVDLRLRISAASCALRQALTVQDPSRTQALVVKALTELDGAPTAEVRIRGQQTEWSDIPGPLTGPQLAALRLAAHGMSNVGIGQTLGITHTAVSERLRRAAKTLGVSTRLAAIVAAEKAGYDLEGPTS